MPRKIKPKRKVVLRRKKKVVASKPKRKVVLRRKKKVVASKPKRQVVLRRRDTHSYLSVANARKLLGDLRRDRNPRKYWRMRKADLLKEASKFKYRFVQGKDGRPELRPTGTGMRRQRVYKLKK